MTTLNLQPPRVPLVDPQTGMITREWYRFITDSFARQGGHDAPTNNDLDLAMPEDSGVAELEMTVRSLVNDSAQVPLQISPLIDDLNLNPPLIQLQIMSETIETLCAEVRASADMIAVLTKQVDDIKQGLTI